MNKKDKYHLSFKLGGHLRSVSTLQMYAQKNPSQSLGLKRESIGKNLEKLWEITHSCPPLFLFPPATPEPHTGTRQTGSFHQHAVHNEATTQAVPA